MQTQTTSAPARSYKPRLRPRADGTILVTLPCGTAVTLHPKGDKWLVENQWGSCGRALDACSLERAIAIAAHQSKLTLAPLQIVHLESIAKQAERSTKEACQIIRECMKARTGRDWSVRAGRGTSGSWIRISAPPRRMNDYELTVEDQILMRAMFGEGSYHQGKQVAPTMGYRGLAVFHACGVSVPSDWKVAEHGWD